MIALLASFAALLSEVLKVFDSSGGPEAINKWLNGAILEVQAMQVPKPDKP